MVSNLSESSPTKNPHTLFLHIGTKTIFKTTYVYWTTEEKFDDALKQVCQHGGTYKIRKLKADGEKPYNAKPCVEILKTVKVTKSKVADDAAAGASAGNDPNVTTKIAAASDRGHKEGSGRSCNADADSYALNTGRILRQKYVYVAWFALHFLLIFLFSCRETLRLVAEGPTILPASFKSFSQKAETTVSVALGQHLARVKPDPTSASQLICIVAGIETGYGYFAPNVPGSYKLVFELHYPDGRVEYELPSVSSAAAGLRIASLLDRIGRTQHDVLREHLVKTLAQSIWREHPEVKTIRAVFGSISFAQRN